MDIDTKWVKLPHPVPVPSTKASFDRPGRTQKFNLFFMFFLPAFFKFFEYHLILKLKQKIKTGNLWVSKC